MELSKLASAAGAWLRGDGPESGIVVSTRVRLARNIAGYPFLKRMTPDQQAEVCDQLRRAADELDLIDKPTFIDLDSASELDRQLLTERHLISRELATVSGPRGVLFGSNETAGLMINEEDHIRMQVLRSGLQLEACWEQASEMDDRLESRIDFAFDDRLGYLSACPTNVGTGLRVSVMIHLPALVITRQIEKVFQAVARMRLAVRGLYGEGTEASGDFYQISNQVTLGKSEPEIIETLGLTIPRVIEYERKARETLARESEVFLDDRIWRAVGMLTHARQMSSEEAMSLLSAVRMGLHVGRLSGVDLATLNRLFITSQPGHLQVIKGRMLNPQERDVVRADYVRKAFREMNFN